LRIPRGISYKLAFVFLFLGIVPMTLVGVTAYVVARDTMAETYVEQFVERVARDTTINLETSLNSMRVGTELLAGSTNFRNNVYDLSLTEENDNLYIDALERIRSDLNNSIEILGNADLLAVVDLEGRILVTSNRTRRDIKSATIVEEGDTTLFVDDRSNPLSGRDLTNRKWWKKVQTGQSEIIEWGIEALVQEAYGYPKFLDKNDDDLDSERPKNAEAFTFGFAKGINHTGSNSVDGEGEILQAVLVAFFNWRAVQDLLDRVNEDFEARSSQFPSGYTFLFKSDLDTIIAHKYAPLYSSELRKDHGLDVLHRAMKDSKDGHDHVYYDFRGAKVSAFAPVKLTGWMLGFGIAEDDYLESTRHMGRSMLVAGLLVAGLIIVFIAISSRRITRPILNLIRQTNEIARGNLDARVEISTGDEIGLLGDSFNKMTEDLKISNKKLIQAEKTAAWREMANQVAHEIKNPLTPIKLSAQLVRRAYIDKHPDFEEILNESVGNIVSQAESLRRIASNFSNYAAFPKTERKPHGALALITECVKLYSNKESSGIEVKLESFLDNEIEMNVDKDEIMRVFFNLFNNAFESMPDGGLLSVSVFHFDEQEGGPDRLEIRITDTGKGIDEKIAERLFEPYFTTRSSGTGLGLAICKKTIEGYGGDLSLESKVGTGTTVRIQLPIK
jgi:signal transduction histidine kinase